MVLLKRSISIVTDGLSLALDALGEFCYPGSCAICKEPSPSRIPLCDRCSRYLRALEEEGACRNCGMPLSQWGAPCPYCMGKGRGRIKQVIRLGRYVEPLRGVIHAMKYHRRWPIAEYLADRLLEDVAVQELLGRADVLVPVPLYWRRQFHRGYNQSEVLARYLGRQCHRRVIRAAIRRYHTPAQAGLKSHQARIENVKDAFKLKRGISFSGQHVVLVDDVLTSGATLASLAKVLAPARPARITAIVIAIADPQNRDFEVI